MFSDSHMMASARSYHVRAYSCIDEEHPHNGASLHGVIHVHAEEEACHQRKPSVRGNAAMAPHRANHRRPLERVKAPVWNASPFQIPSSANSVICICFPTAVVRKMRGTFALWKTVSRGQTHSLASAAVALANFGHRCEEDEHDRDMCGAFSHRAI